ncbi:MAG TPA: (Fe-S)-binding protein [Limnobacter sp.]|uniref:(Fe-S)-binding protein n=1 Tax=Limnobacter sp. TaxID=2003368 RepID=UPI002E310841|nr:(Fe-S)-binding protein [Limnobacter sp.]HEX5487277.1 (Fe-S)-binding protein [Limnobacter sp.]
MRVGFFVTCLVDSMRPSIGFSAIELLESAGCEVVVPPAQTCCGQPAWNSGDRQTTRDLAIKWLKEFEAFEHVVMPSGSCASMVVSHYKQVFESDPDLKWRASQLAQRTWELTDFLVNVLGMDKLKLRKSPELSKVTYHDSCSGLRDLGVKAQPRALIDQLEGLELVEMKDCEQCCGFGGTFAMKYGDVSSAICSEKCENIENANAQAVVLGDLGCMMNIQGRLARKGTHVKVLHVAELITGKS